MESPSGCNESHGPPTHANGVPQPALLDIFFPGLSGISSVVHRYAGIDLNVYIPLFVLFTGLTFAWDYAREYIWGVVSDYFMSEVEIRVDDEIYNMIMAWVATQEFAKSSRRFVVNTNLSSRSWNLWTYNYYEDTEDDDEDADSQEMSTERQQKSLSYTPSFGSHRFWYKGRLLFFHRTLNREQVNMTTSEKEEITISCFGRNPQVIKELLMETKLEYTKQDSKKTVIYRGTCKGSGTEPTWQRRLARISRPLSTVILSEDKKKQLLDDITDYLAPATHRWYSNRGIPYRRGYLLYGPPGTGKSSFSLALAGHFKMRIYIVSLNSLSSSEENLSALFAELPRRCVVLLEDIDTAGLTNTRETPVKPADGKESSTPASPPSDSSSAANSLGRVSLSGLLNILDGVASQEGRILIMTTNHLEKLDKALIRPGRVDMSIEFGLADNEISASIFNAIYTKLEADADDPSKPKAGGPLPDQPEKRPEGKSAEDDDEKIKALALEFAAAVPAHEFSPAEVQGYLLRYKRSPADAVANIGDWVLEMRKQKKEKALSQVEKKEEPTTEKKEEPTTEKETLGEEPTKGRDEAGGKNGLSLPEDVNGVGTNGE